MIINPLAPQYASEQTMLATPSSLREEHEEIIGSLEEFSLLNDRTGNAVKELLKVLLPHFEKEERLAMPLLGGLSELISGKNQENLEEIYEARGPLLEEYENMFHEHSQLNAKIERGQGIALQEGHQDVADLLSALAHHARVEEEVLYPAALLATSFAEKMLMTAAT
jgi:hypothetical protein